MIITQDVARYVLTVINQLPGLLDQCQLTDRCPDCGMVATPYNTRDHITAMRTEDSTSVVMIVGCNETFVVDPALIGVHAPGWVGPYRDDDDEAGNDGGAIPLDHDPDRADDDWAVVSVGGHDTVDLRAFGQDVPVRKYPDVTNAEFLRMMTRNM